MTRLELARTEEREAAQAVNEAYASKDMQRVRLATEWHLRCLAHRRVAELRQQTA